MEKLAHRITIVLFGIIVMFTILGIVAVIGEGNAFGNATSLFNLDTEMSLPNWFSTILLFTLSLITFFIAITETVEKRQFARHWQILGFIFLMMSMEEVAGIRDAVITDPLRNLLNLDGIFYYSWVIPIGILTVIFVVAYARFMKNLPSKTRTFFIMGILVYVIGAIGLELISGLVISNNAYSETFNYLTILEEILELIGVTLLIHSLVTYMTYESWEMVTLEKIKDSNIQIQSWFAVILGALALVIISFLTKVMHF